MITDVSTEPIRQNVPNSLLYRRLDTGVSLTELVLLSDCRLSVIQKCQSGIPVYMYGLRWSIETYSQENTFAYYSSLRILQRQPHGTVVLQS